MKKMFLGACLIIPLLTVGQIDKTRVIKGKVFDKTSNDYPIGSNVIQYKTTNGSIIQADGTFELSVAKDDTVLIHIPFCFESYYVMYLPTENFKKIVLSKKLKKESEKVLLYWEKRKNI